MSLPGVVNVSVVVYLHPRGGNRSLALMDWATKRVLGFRAVYLPGPQNSVEDYQSRTAIFFLYPNQWSERCLAENSAQVGKFWW